MSIRMKHVRDKKKQKGKKYKQILVSSALVPFILEVFMICNILIINKHLIKLIQSIVPF